MSTTSPIHCIGSYNNMRSITKLKRLLKRLLRLLPMAQAGEDGAAAADPPPFDPLKPATPVSYPVKTMNDLLSRSYFRSFHYPFNKASTPLVLPAGSPAGLPQRPRLLVCHDMQGGYVDDKWVQGGANSDAYAIWHWYLVDVFVYFSHNLVTLPPPCWTNAGHAHGVKVLGTFITEWDEGRAACDVLLSSKESAHQYAELLTELAVALGFDGWLLNMEVNLDQTQIPNLKEFVSHLTKTMHSSVPGSLVIWYDSVTKDGVLDWQNQLNEYNKPFFDLCDGIFVNYTWEEDYPKKSASIAGERKFDVYMGIDVFGRGTFGGGQWTTNVALDVIKKDYVSAALFAPGWVYETKQPPDFQSAQNRWWGLVEKSWSLAQKYPKRLPFYSNFDQGHGLHVFIEGKKVSSSSWNNISAQTLQPILDGSLDPSPSTVEASIDLKDASYSGGSSIKFSGTIEADSSVLIRLFEADIPMGDLPIYITYSVNLEADSMLGISIGFTKTLEKVSILLLHKDRVFPPPRQLTSKFDKVITACEISKFIPDKVDGKGWTLQQASVKMKDYTLTDINVVCHKAGKFHTGENFESDKNNTLHNAATGYHASLGHISIRHSDMNMVFPPASSWLVTGEDIQWGSGSQGTKTVSLKISWKLKAGSDDSSMFSKYNVYFSTTSKQFTNKDEDNLVVIDGTYLGVAKVESFYIDDLIIHHDVSKLLFIIQVCSIDGACQRLDESPTFQLQTKNRSYLQMDVGLLSDAKAIDNSFGTDNDVAKFFNHLRKDVFDIEHHCMAMQFEDVSRFYRRRWNGRWFEFKWPSFSSSWLFMLAMAALILMLLTFTQAAVSVFSRINPYC